MNSPCTDQDGWSPVSRTRDFDLTLCFEVFVVLPTFLGLLLILGILRAFQLTKNHALPRTTKSRRILKAKLVRLSIH